MQFQMHTHNVQLALGQNVTLALFGNFIMVQSAEGAIDVLLDNGDVCAEEVIAGFKYRLPDGQTFQSVTLINRSGYDNQVKLAYGIGDFTVERLGQPGAREMNTSGFGVLNCANGASTQLTTAEQGRRTTMVQAALANTGPVFIVDSNYGAAGNGIQLLPGQTVFLDVACELWARNDSGAAQIVYRANFYD